MIGGGGALVGPMLLTSEDALVMVRPMGAWERHGVDWNT